MPLLILVLLALSVVAVPVVGYVVWHDVPPASLGDKR
jgi:hypothetical protein